jgi:thermitase
MDMPFNCLRPHLCRSRLLLVVCGLGAFLTGQLAAQNVVPGPLEAQYASTHVVVKLAPGMVPAFRGGSWTIDGLAPEARPALAKTLARWNAQGFSAALPSVPENNGGLERFYFVHVAPGTDTAAMAAELSALGIFEVAEVDGLGTTATIPNDQWFTFQYGMHNTGSTGGTPGADIGAPEAWDVTTGDASVRIAVCDAGVSEHAELAGRLVDGVNVLGGGDWGDSCASHGTHVAGIAAATGDNGIGVAGVAWDALVIPIRILNGCTGSESGLAAGITYAMEHDADVINMSLQFGTGSTLLRTAVEAAHAAGITLVAATGNNGFTGGVAFPGRWPETIAVGATDDQDAPPTFGGSGWTSNAGPEIDLAAPGDSIYSTTGTTGYGFKNGTSMATPHVSGVVALMLSIDPTLGPEDVRQILHETAEDVYTPGFDENTGHGRINASAALQAVLDGVAIPGDTNGDGVVDVSDLVTVIVAWGTCSEVEPCPADLNDDGQVDVLDLIEVIVNWS